MMDLFGRKAKAKEKKFNKDNPTLEDKKNSSDQVIMNKIRKEMEEDSKRISARKKKRLASKIAELSAEGVGSASDRADQAREFYDNTSMRDDFEKQNFLGGRPRKIAASKTMANKMPKIREDEFRMNEEETIKAIKSGFGNTSGIYQDYNSGGKVKKAKVGAVKNYKHGGAVMAGRGGSFKGIK